MARRKAESHGNCVGGRQSLEYNSWRAMKARCGNPNHVAYQHYGGRGIRVCDAWQDSFKAFLLDMGPRPSPLHSLDRIDVNAGYSKKNCRWATPSEQARNKRLHCRDARASAPMWTNPYDVRVTARAIVGMMRGAQGGAA